MAKKHKLLKTDKSTQVKQLPQFIFSALPIPIDCSLSSSKLPPTASFPTQPPAKHTRNSATTPDLRAVPSDLQAAPPDLRAAPSDLEQLEVVAGGRGRLQRGQHLVQHGHVPVHHVNLAPQLIRLAGDTGLV